MFVFSESLPERKRVALPLKHFELWKYRGLHTRKVKQRDSLWTDLAFISPGNEDNPHSLEVHLRGDVPIESYLCEVSVIPTERESD